jgi:hypothetical protein
MARFRHGHARARRGSPVWRIVSVAGSRDNRRELQHLADFLLRPTRPIFSIRAM